MRDLVTDNDLHVKQISSICIILYIYILCERYFIVYFMEEMKQIL